MRLKVGFLVAMGGIMVASGPVAFANNYARGSSRAVVAAASKPNCQTLLDNNSFQCHIKSSFGADFNDCFQFFSPGVSSSQFDVVVVGLTPEHLGCACDAKGSLKDPKFYASKSFDCLGNSFGAYSFKGKVAGGSKLKIKKGLVTNSFGDTYVYECTLSPAPCGASPSGAFLDGPLQF